MFNVLTDIIDNRNSLIYINFISNVNIHVFIP